MRRFLALVGVLSVAVRPALGAADPNRLQQWALDRIRAEASWTVSRGAEETIAIIDTGIDLDHPDLAPKTDGRYTCIDQCRPGGDDDNGHGSLVAGIAAAETGNGEGVAGAAPDARLMSVKVLNKEGRGTLRDVTRGMRWAADHGANVVNLSLGDDRYPVIVDSALDLNLFQQAVSYVWSKGGVVVAAAGNSGSTASSYAGTLDLLVVGATGPDDRIASYSTHNIGVDVYAPGGDPDGGGCSASRCVLSTFRDGGYAYAAGTSMSAPHVSALAAQLLRTGLTNQQAVDRITSTAAPTPDGATRIDSAAAVGARPVATAPPGVGGTTPPGGGTTRRTPAPAGPARAATRPPDTSPGGTLAPAATANAPSEDDATASAPAPQAAAPSGRRRSNVGANTAAAALLGGGLAAAVAHQAWRRFRRPSAP
jgi:subtilisin family serine protease